MNKPSSQYWGWGFVAPVVVGVAILNYWPAIHALWLSMQSWNLLDAPTFVGLDNYRELLASDSFWMTVKQTSIYVIGVVLLEIVLALTIAMSLYKVTRGKKVFQILSFLPYVTPALAVSLIFAWLYHPEQGLINAVLLKTSLMSTPLAWLYTPWSALVAVMSLEVWKATGYNMLLLLGALQAIPKNLDEAAMLDGAQGFKKAWLVTLPQIAPTLFLVGLMTIIHALQAFDAIYLLTQGGPNRATTVLAFALYEAAFQRFELGQATAIGYIMFSVIAVLTLIQWYARKHWVWQEEGVS